MHTLHTVSLNPQSHPSARRCSAPHFVIRPPSTDAHTHATSIAIDSIPSESQPTTAGLFTASFHSVSELPSDTSASSLIHPSLRIAMSPISPTTCTRLSSTRSRKLCVSIPSSLPSNGARCVPSPVLVHPLMCTRHTHTSYRARDHAYSGSITTSASRRLPVSYTLAHGPSLSPVSRHRMPRACMHTSAR